MKKSTRVKPTYEGIQLCILNSERLFNDSLEVSKPSSAALLELSLEEISKAWKMFFRLQGESYEDEREKLMEKYNFINIHDGIEETVEYQSLIDFMDAHHKELYTLDINSSEFVAHSKKLDYIGLIVSYLKVLLPLTRKILDMDEVWRITSFGILNLPKRKNEDGESEFDQAELFLSSINENYMAEFTKLKEGGFYVDYSDGTFVFPSINPVLINSLEFLVTILINGLKSSLRLLYSK